jgi:hypothetical protein
MTTTAVVVAVTVTAQVALLQASSSRSFASVPVLVALRKVVGLNGNWWVMQKFGHQGIEFDLDALFCSMFPDILFSI